MAAAKPECYIKYPAHSIFEHGIFAPYATLDEAKEQVANDIRDGNDESVEAIVKSNASSGIIEVPDWNTVPTKDFGHKAGHYEIVHDIKAIKKFAPALQEKIIEDAVKGQADYLLEVDRAIKAGQGLKNVVPGNAYTVCSGGTATAGAIALAAATAKTVIGIAAGTANQGSIVEVSISFDGVTSSAVPVLVEWVSGTNATNPPGTASTSQTPKQVRGWPAQTSQNTAAYNWTTEPTVLEVFKKRLLTPNGGLLILQYPLGREPTGFVTATTQFKFIGLRLTAPAIVNCHVDMEYEE